MTWYPAFSKLTPQKLSPLQKIAMMPSPPRLTQLLVHPRIAGHGPTLYQGGLPRTRRLELVSVKPLRNGAVALHYRRER